LCQLPGKPTQEWEQCHIQFDGGRNDGFVKSQSGPLDAGFPAGLGQAPVQQRSHCSAGQSGESHRLPARSGLILVVSFICHGEKDDGLRRSDQWASVVRPDLRPVAKTLGRRSSQGACSSRGTHSRRHVSAFPRKRFVKFCTRRFRGNVADMPASGHNDPGSTCPRQKRAVPRMAAM